MNSLLETVDIVDGPQNPTGIYKYVKAYAEANGKFEQVDEYTKVQLRYLYLVQNTAPYIVDAAAKSAAIKLFKEKEGGFDRYYKVIRISDTGDMYDITDESEMKLVIELVPE